MSADFARQHRLERAEPLLVAVATPLLLLPRGPLPWVGMGLLLLGWGSRGLACGKWVLRTPLDVPLLVLALMALASLFSSANLALSLPKFYGIFLGIFIYYAVVSGVSKRQHFWLGIALLLASTIGVSLVGLVGTEWIIGKYPAFQGVYNLIPRAIRSVQTSVGPAAGIHPNELGGTLAFLLPLPLALMLGSQISRRQKAALVAIISLSLIVLGLSASRSALVGLAVAALVLTAWRWRRAGLSLLASAAVMVGVIAFLRAGVIGDLFLEIDATSVAPGMGTLPTRLEIWDRASNMIRDFPFTGIGLNTFPIVLTALYPTFLGTIDALVPHAHNIFLQTAVDLGLSGVLAFVAVWAILARTAWQAYRRNAADPAMKASIVGILSGMLAYLVFGLTDAITLGAKPMPAMWLMAGLLVASWRMGPAWGPTGLDAGEEHALEGSPLPGGRFRPAALALGRFLGDAYWALTFLLLGLGLLVTIGHILS